MSRSVSCCQFFLCIKATLCDLWHFAQRDFLLCGWILFVLKGLTQLSLTLLGLGIQTLKCCNQHSSRSCLQSRQQWWVKPVIQVSTNQFFCPTFLSDHSQIKHWTTADMFVFYFRTLNTSAQQSNSDGMKGTDTSGQPSLGVDHGQIWAPLWSFLAGGLCQGNTPAPVCVYACVSAKLWFSIC